jgi:hypothetical protein
MMNNDGMTDETQNTDEWEDDVDLHSHAVNDDKDAPRPIAAASRRISRSHPYVAARQTPDAVTDVVRTVRCARLESAEGMLGVQIM